MPRLNPDSRGQTSRLLQANFNQLQIVWRFKVSHSTVSHLQCKLKVCCFTIAVSTAAQVHGPRWKNISHYFPSSLRLRMYNEHIVPIHSKRPLFKKLILIIFIL